MVQKSHIIIIIIKTSSAIVHVISFSIVVVCFKVAFLFQSTYPCLLIVPFRSAVSASRWGNELRDPAGGRQSVNNNKQSTLAESSGRFGFLLSPVSAEMLMARCQRRLMTRPSFCFIHSHAGDSSECYGQTHWHKARPPPRQQRQRWNIR